MVRERYFGTIAVMVSLFVELHLIMLRFFKKQKKKKQKKQGVVTSLILHSKDAQ